MIQLTDKVCTEGGATHVAAERLRDMDFSGVNQRLIGKGHEEHDVDQLREQAIRFLSLAATTDINLVPSHQVDEYWHELILNTHLYEGIGNVLGRFIHHVPSENPDDPELRIAYINTRAALQSVFGEVDHRYWPEKSGMSGCVGELCSC